MDKRKIVLWTGNLLASANFGVIMTIIIGGLGLIPLFFPDAVKTYLGIQSTNQIKTYIESIIAIVVILFFVSQIVGHLLIRWGKTIHPKIRIIPLNEPDMETIYSVGGSPISIHFASLNIVNDEDSELSEAYAVLLNTSPVIGMGGLGTGHGERKLEWKNTDNCSVNVGAWGRKEILHVYLLSIGRNRSNKMGALQSCFCLCGDDHSLRGPEGTYEFNMELNGKLNGDSIKPIPFHGSFDVSVNSQSDDTIVFRITAIREIKYKN